MLRNRIYAACATALAAMVLSSIVLAQQQPGVGAKAPRGPKTKPARTVGVTAPKGAKSAAATAIDQAAKADKYIFVFFYRTEDEPTQTARTAFEATMPKFADRAAFTTVNLTDPQEQGLVSRYKLSRSPAPLVLAIAPVGVVTRAFRENFTEEQFETAFVSLNMQKCLKAMQNRKLVLLCVQNTATQHNAEAMSGVLEFSADEQYAKSTEVITIDPADAAEESLLKQFKVDPKTSEAVTVFLAPPGRILGTYAGAIQKDDLIAAAKTAAKGCTPGSSCCPAKKKPAAPAAQPQSQEPQPEQPGDTEKKP